jgi:hypothetical protein
VGPNNTADRELAERRQVPPCQSASLDTAVHGRIEVLGSVLTAVPLA